MVSALGSVGWNWCSRFVEAGVGMDRLGRDVLVLDQELQDCGRSHALNKLYPC